MSLREALRLPAGGGLGRPRLWWSIGFAGIVLLIVLELVPAPPSLKVDPGGWSDHALAYATLMAWFARLDAGTRYRGGIAFALVVLGIALECAQGLTTWRTFDGHDMIANAIGVAAGWIASPPRLPSGLPTIERLLFGRPA
jgi:hypothetical protein